MADLLNPMPGMAVAVDADMPAAKVEITVQGDDLPAGGNAGDVLTKTENGTEWKGISAAAGGYYTPSVSENGDLSWTASKSDMPAVEPVNIKGRQGDTGDTGPAGPAGADGYTPVKGVDYYTDADKDELVQAVMSALPAAEGVSY